VVKAADQVYATGRRKEAVARVWMGKGSGAITVNGIDMKKAFPREVLHIIVNQPFDATETLDQYDVKATVVGGGLSGQAEAVRHAIARALLQVDEKNKGPLRKNGLLTRDPRSKERKKYGQKGARKRFQFTKR